MKQILFVAIILLAFSACKKEKVKNEPEPPVAFGVLTKADIQKKEASMSLDAMIISNDNGLLWSIGKRLIFKTNAGRYGKMEVIAIKPAKNYQLTILATVFNEDGTVHKQTTGLEIEGTFYCDLDEMMMSNGTPPGTTDFLNERQTATKTRFSPSGGARFMVYEY